MTTPKQIICTSCKNPFTPIVMASGLHFSKLCTSCLYSKEMAKRRELSAKKVPSLNRPKTAKNGIKVDLINRTNPWLLDKATEQFNLFIRNRDRLEGDRFYCPTCKKIKHIEVKDGKSNYQACHCFPAGFYPSLKFNENNVFGGCLSCNYFKHGVNYEYNDWVRARIGEEEYQRLKDMASYWKRNQWKWDRFYLIDIINEYTKRNKGYQILTNKD